MFLLSKIEGKRIIVRFPRSKSRRVTSILTAAPSLTTASKLLITSGKSLSYFCAREEIKQILFLQKSKSHYEGTNNSLQLCLLISGSFPIRNKFSLDIIVLDFEDMNAF